MIKKLLNKLKTTKLSIYLDFFLMKKMLNAAKIGTLRNIWIDIKVPKVDGEPVSKDKKILDEQRFKIFKRLCNSLPKELKIIEINLSWRSLKQPNFDRYETIRFEKPNEEFIKEAERAVKKIRKSDGIILPYHMYIEVDGCDLYNVFEIYVCNGYDSNAAILIEVNLWMEKLNLFERRKFKPYHLKTIHKFIKEFAKKVGGTITDVDWERSSKWEENMDIYEDHFRKDLSPRALKLLEEGKIERFMWDLYLTRFDGKEVDLTHWRYGKLKKGDYEPLKRAIKSVLDNLPKEFKIKDIWVNIEELNEHSYEGGFTRKGVTLKKARDKYYDSIVKIISKTKVPLRVRGISIDVIIDGIEDAFRIEIKVNHRNMSRKFLVVCSMIMNIFSRKDVKKEHIIKIDKFVRKLLRKNPNLELDYVYYKEKGWASYQRVLKTHFNQHFE